MKILNNPRFFYCPGCGAKLELGDIIGLDIYKNHTTGRCPNCRRQYCFTCGEFIG
jgi:hypothetical protein